MSDTPYILELREWASSRVKEYKVNRNTIRREVLGRFRSKSSPTVVYTVEKAGGNMICNCPGYIFRKSCKHTKEVMASC